MFCDLPFPGLWWVHESSYGRGTRSLPEVGEQKTDRYVLSWVQTCEFSRLWWSLAVVWFVWRRRRRWGWKEGGRRLVLYPESLSLPGRPMLVWGRRGRLVLCLVWFPSKQANHWSGKGWGWSRTSCGYCAFSNFFLCRAYLATRGQHHTNYASWWRTGEIAQGTLPSHCLCHSIHDNLTKWLMIFTMQILYQQLK